MDVDPGQPAIADVADQQIDMTARTVQGLPEFPSGPNTVALYFKDYIARFQTGSEGGRSDLHVSDFQADSSVQVAVTVAMVIAVPGLLVWRDPEGYAKTEGLSRCGRNPQ
jgi:hypothetical protein